MIIDKNLELASAQAVTTDAASTNYIDAVEAGDALAGSELELIVRGNVTATAAGAATVTFDLETDDNSSFSSATILASSGAIGKASLLADTVIWRTKVPAGMEQYLRVNMTVGTGPLTAGKFDIFFVPLSDIKRP